MSAAEYVWAILPFVGIGFVAQVIDGALGMGFGVITNTLLASVVGIPPARASASVHLVEGFTTAASAISHVAQRNVDWRLFARLVLPGVAGAVAGAYVLSSVDGAVARPYVAAYLVGVGVHLLWRAGRLDRGRAPQQPRFIAPLGLAGGFLDAAGGGGWGPIVTSNLLAQGAEPRRTIGTVNTAEFFLALTVSLAFVLTLGAEAFTLAAVGMIIGGLVAAPVGARLARRVTADRLLSMVGVTLIATSSFSLWRALA